MQEKMHLSYSLHKSVFLLLGKIVFSFFFLFACFGSFLAPKKVVWCQCGRRGMAETECCAHAHFGKKLHLQS